MTEERWQEIKGMVKDSFEVLDMHTEPLPEEAGPGEVESIEFNGPAGIDIDGGGNVFVVDFYNYRIQKFDANGNFIVKWGSFGTLDGQFKSPWGVAVDSLGNVYVTDTTNRRVQKFDSNGEFITNWKAT